jgi:wyosine [tRNA(Phe)-imidazoG37] synthetase (radical SAM superfamily)
LRAAAASRTLLTVTSSGCAACGDHVPLIDGVVYGPVASRRLGISLGVNILPPNQKICTFNCTYCQYGWTLPMRPAGFARVAWPAPDAVHAAVAEALAARPSGAAPIDRITLAGHGEPTLHPELRAVIEGVRAARTQLAPSARIAVLSNSTTAHLPAVRDALSAADERFMKLDAGDQATLRRMNAAAARVTRIVDALAAMPHVTLQAMFVSDPRGRLGNTTPDSVEPWLAAVARIRPDAVHIYTLARPPAWPGLEAAPRTLLDDLARTLEGRGTPALVF